MPSAHVVAQKDTGKNLTMPNHNKTTTKKG